MRLVDETISTKPPWHSKLELSLYYRAIATLDKDSSLSAESSSCSFVFEPENFEVISVISDASSVADSYKDSSLSGAES